MTALRNTNADISNVAVDGRDEGTDGDGFALDNCDAVRCFAQYFHGVAAILGRSTAPRWNHDDMPCLSYFRGRAGGDGIRVDAVDWLIDRARVCGMKRHGLDIWQGNLHESNSKIYGTDIGVRVRPGVALCNFQGTESSDSRIGGLIQGNETTIANWFGEHNSQCGLIVGAKALIAGLRVNSSRDILNVQPNHTPTTHIDFASRTDKEFGGLCGNWSTLIGAHFDVLPGDTAIVANAHMLTIADAHVNGEADATALLVEQPVDGLQLDMTVCGPAVVIKQLGGNCNINIRFHQSPPRFDLPAAWNDTNRITINGVPATQGKATR
jgi:hypothetical protein